MACALARLGTVSAFIGRLGDDAIGAAFRDLFAQRGVDTSALQSDTARPSRVVLVGTIPLASPAATAALGMLVERAMERSVTPARSATACGAADLSPAGAGGADQVRCRESGMVVRGNGPPSRSMRPCRWWTPPEQAMPSPPVC